MKPVMFWRKTSGIRRLQQSSTKWAPFWADSAKSTPLLATIPTWKPSSRANPVTSVSPYICLNSWNREPSTMRAISSRGSTWWRKSSGMSP